MTPQFTASIRSCAQLSRQRTVRRTLSVATLVWLAASLCAAPPATADSADTLASAVTAVRGGSCPLRANPIVTEAADEANDSNDKWLDQASRAVPVPDATPLLKDLGYGGTKSMLLTSAGRTPADAIQAVLLQGYRAIPDCSYVDYGVSYRHNASKDLFLTAVVLAA